MAVSKMGNAPDKWVFQLNSLDGGATYFKHLGASVDGWNLETFTNDSLIIRRGSEQSILILQK